MIRKAGAAAWLMVLTAAPALAQEEHDACQPGEACADPIYWGAWGMIGIGVLFFLIAAMPHRAPTGGETEGGLPLLGKLQARIEKELTGWRRWQWPVLGLFFIALGLSTLLGWP